MKQADEKLEVWLRGPLQDMPLLLQPVAHALLQAREELNELMDSFSNILLWERPAGLASPAFHLQHLTGVLDRLFTYARAEMLTEQQLLALQLEGRFDENITTSALVNRFNNQVDIALIQLRQTNESLLTEIRGVGKKQIPSTVLGLYTHAAEHTMRHLGQLLVTVKIISSKIHLPNS
jgi:hypothetical protein